MQKCESRDEELHEESADCKAERSGMRNAEENRVGNGISVQILTECSGRISKKQVLRPLAEKRGWSLG